MGQCPPPPPPRPGPSVIQGSSVSGALQHGAGGGVSHMQLYNRLPRCLIENPPIKHVMIKSRKLGQ